MNTLAVKLVLSGTVSLLVAYLSTPAVIQFARKIKIVDDPGKSKHPKVIHTYPVPRGGGLAIFLAIAVSALIFLPIDSHLLAILAGASVITVVGIADDKYNLNPYLRLILQLVAAGMPIMAGIGISFTTNPLGGILDLSRPNVEFGLFGSTRSILFIPDLFALIWIVMLMNFINMGAKGVDGQLPGVASIAAFTIAALSLRFSADITQWPVTILAVITACSFLGFLPWDKYPQKIMPSFAGSNLAGYFLGVLSILTTAKVGTLLVVLGIPLIDTGYTMLRRIMEGKSPVWGDRGHLHHKLLDSGLSKKQVALFYWAATFLLGLLALNLNATLKLYTIIGIAIFIGGLLLWLTYRSES